MVTRSPVISAHGVRERFDCQSPSLEGLRDNQQTSTIKKPVKQTPILKTRLFKIARKSVSTTR